MTSHLWMGTVSLGEQRRQLHGSPPLGAVLSSGFCRPPTPGLSFLSVRRGATEFGLTVLFKL